MAYPYKDSVASFKSLLKPLRDLAYTDTPFDPGFASRLPEGGAYEFDAIKDRVCAFRSLNAKQKLRSADALVVCDGNSGMYFVLIDFKNQKVDNVQSVKDPDCNELMQKAFDSLTVIAMTFGRNMSMQTIQQCSTFVVVYPQQNYSDRFLSALNQCANGEPLWNLGKLVTNEFFADVKTVHDGDFEEIFGRIYSNAVEGCWG